VANQMDKEVAGIAAKTVGTAHQITNNLKTDSGK